jgi:galactokinase
MTGFRKRFGREPQVRVSAPGRVNLIGEHTDYNGGFVLPTVIPQRTVVELARRSDRNVRVSSANTGGAIAEFGLGRESRRGDWADYVQGITWALADADYTLGGADIRIESTVPLGSGLSSSAALEIALLRALGEAFDLPMDGVEMALLGQRAENQFVGAPCGIMDQMACTLAADGVALFLDTRTLEYERVALPAAVELVVINSGVSHSVAGGDYATRRRECEQACAALGVGQLRDLGVPDLARLDSLPDLLRRRARHVVTEDQRVLDAVCAMREGDVERLGALFQASHASMRDDYEVSVPEIDLLVELSRHEPGVYGARLTGGGFGGSIVALVVKGNGPGMAARVTASYAAETGRSASVLVPVAQERR